MGITRVPRPERAHFFRPTPNPPREPPELGALIQRAEQYLIVNRSFSGHFRSVRLSGFGIGFVPPLSFLSQRAQNISAIQIGHATPLSVSLRRSPRIKNAPDVISKFLSVVPHFEERSGRGFPVFPLLVCEAHL